MDVSGRDVPVLKKMSRLKRSRVRTVRFQWPPEWLEAVADNLKVDLTDRRVTGTIAAAVKQLSDAFIDQTRARIVSGDKHISPGADYGDDRLYRTSYTAYYLPVNVPKIIELLESSGLSWGSVHRILDLGTGPGTAPVACLIARSRAGIGSPVNITALDRSRHFLALSENVITTFRRILDIPGSDRFYRYDLPEETVEKRRDLSDTGYDLVTAANILAELPEHALARLPRFFDRTVNAGGSILFLEPARRHPARRVTALRDELVSMGWRVLYPCTGDFPCPVLHRARDWCHHRLAWDTPGHILQVDRLTGMRKNLLNFTGFVLQKPGGRTPDSTGNSIVAHPDGRAPVSPVYVCRVISDVIIQKGRFCVHVCGFIEGSARAVPALLEKRRLTQYNDLFTDLARYDRIRLERTEFRGNQLILNEHSRLTTDFENGDQE
jgi:hypothetical protein